MSAIALLPQLDWWPVNDALGEVNGLTYDNGTFPSRYPTEFNASHVSKRCRDGFALPAGKCAIRNAAPITNWALSHSAAGIDPDIVIDSSFAARHLQGSHENAYGYSVGTTLDNYLTHFIYLYWNFTQKWSEGVIVSSRTPRLRLSALDEQAPTVRPLVQAQCNSLTSFAMSGKATPWRFPTDRLASESGELGDDAMVDVDLSNYKKLSADNKFSSTGMKFHNLKMNERIPLLGVSIGFHHNELGTNAELHENNGNYSIMACTMLSYWVPGNVVLMPTTSNVVEVDLEKYSTLASPEWITSSSRLINIDQRHAQLMNVNSTNLKGMGTIIESETAKLRGDRKGEMHKVQLPWAVATVLSLQFADALSLLYPRDTTTDIFCGGCGTNKTHSDSIVFKADMPLRAHFYPNETANELLIHIADRPDLYTPLIWQFERYGYGWSMTRSISKIAFSFLALHCFSSLLILRILPPKEDAF